MDILAPTDTKPYLPGDDCVGGIPDIAVVFLVGVVTPGESMLNSLSVACRKSLISVTLP